MQLMNCQNYFGKIEDKDYRKKLEEMFCTGKYDDYDLYDVFRFSKSDHTGMRVDGWKEFERRKSFLEFAVKNPEAFKQIVENDIAFFHGTDINALPGILQNGIMCEDSLIKNGIKITTGEKSTRRDWCPREFVSLSEDYDIALKYATKGCYDEQPGITPFGIIIGLSSKDLSDLYTCDVKTYLPEVGVVDRVPESKIKTIFVPKDKVEFISRLIGDRPISVAGLEELTPEITINKGNLKDLAEGRRMSKIQALAGRIKDKFFGKQDKSADKTIEEMGIND